MRYPITGIGPTTKEHHILVLFENISMTLTTYEEGNKSLQKSSVSHEGLSACTYTFRSASVAVIEL